MGHGAHVGRIGALAVALGVGAVIAGIPATGHAAPSDASSTSTDSPSSTGDSPSTHDAGGSSPPPGPPVLPDNTDRRHGSSASTDSPLSARSGIDIAPTVVFGSSGGAHTSALTVAADLSNRGVEQSDTGELKSPSIGKHGSSDSDEDIASIRPEVPAVSGPVDPGPAHPAAGLPVRPASPPSPAEWILLAAARREIGEATAATLVGPTANVATPLPTVALTPPEITGPSAWLPFLSDLAHGLKVLAQRNINIYDFTDPRGWAAFLLDHTWALPTTTAGNLQQIAYLFSSTPPEYRDDLSYHQNRHVYLGGTSSFFGDAGRTLGNVIVIHDVDPNFLTEALAHETVHVRQQRFFGPVQPLTYGAWFAGGALVAGAIWLTDPSQDFKPLLYTIAYFDNPWETWAYKASGGWPPSGELVDPKWLWP